MADLNNELNVFLVRVFNEILRIEEERLKTGEFKNITVRGMHVIEAVCSANEAGKSNRASDIAEALHISAGTLTAEAAQLEGKGCITRVQDTQDKRVVRLYATDLGKRANEAHHKFHRSMVTSVLEALTPEEAESLVKGLKRISEFFSRM